MKKVFFLGLILSVGSLYPVPPTTWNQTQTESRIVKPKSLKELTRDLDRKDFQDDHHYNLAHSLHSTTALQSPEWRSSFYAILGLCLARERTFQPQGNIVLYHGHSGMIKILQDLHEELYRRTNKLPNDPIKNFVFFRDPTTTIGSMDSFFKSFANLADIWDEHDHIRLQLLSSSFSCHETGSAESAHHFFTHNTSINKWKIRSFINPLLTRCGFRESYAGKLCELYKKLDGFLTQIFIPYSIADQCVYFSHPYGIPNMEFKEAPCSETIHKIASGAVTPGHNIQLRIVLTSAYFANPHSGIQMYHYTTTPAHIFKEFTAEKEKLFAQMRADWEADHHQSYWA